MSWLKKLFRRRRSPAIDERWLIRFQGFTIHVRPQVVAGTPCWVYLSSGFASLGGHPEVQLVVLRRELEPEEEFPHSVAPIFGYLFAAAMANDPVRPGTILPLPEPAFWGSKLQACSNLKNRNIVERKNQLSLSNYSSTKCKCTFLKACESRHQRRTLPSCACAAPRSAESSCRL